MSDTPTTSPEVNPASDYVAEESFDQLPLSDAMRKGIAERGYTAPTPVQARALRPALAGRDLIVRSKTGTGKTAAFGIPTLERIDVTRAEPQALALCPTRELAIQVAEEVEKLGRAKGVKVSAIYGGAPIGKQVEELESGAQFIVGTPGRVFDLIRRKNLKLGNCRVAILDEADEMLNQGFFEEVMRILEQLPEGRQTLLFSATVTPDIERLIKRFTHDPETILLSGDTYTVEGITNVRYDYEDAYPKPRNLLYILEKEQPDNAIIFCNTRDDTGLVTAVLNRNGFDAELLNGDLAQKDRERVMAKVKAGELQFMVATDIAARGIDISDLGHVINYSLPEDPAVYLHRVGRTGRIGKQGVAISIVSGAEISTLSVLEKKYGIVFERRKLPSPEEAQRIWTEKHVKEIQEAASGSVYDAMISMARDLKKRDDGDQLFAFLLKYFFTHHRMEVAARAGKAPPVVPEFKPAARKPEPRRERERERPAREERGPKRERPPERPRRPDTKPDPANEVVGERIPGSRPAASPAAAEEAPSGRAKIWVNLGASDGLDAAGIKAALQAISGLDPANIADLELRATHSYVFVEPPFVDALLTGDKKEHGGKAVRIEKPRRRR
jgi:ATP-dependent RNA helicase DeaD